MSAWMAEALRLHDQPMALDLFINNVQRCTSYIIKTYNHTQETLPSRAYD